MRPDAAIDFDPRSQCLTPRLIQASAKLNPPPLALLASRRRLTHGTFHARRASGFHAAGNKRSRLDFLMRIDRFGSCIQPMSTRAKKPKRSSSPYQLGNDSRCGADRLHGSRSGVGFPTPIHPSSNCPREALASTPKPRAAPSLRAVNVCRQQESRHPATRQPGRRDSCWPSQFQNCCRGAKDARVPISVRPATAPRPTGPTLNPLSESSDANPAKDQTRPAPRGPRSRWLPENPECSWLLPRSQPVRVPQCAERTRPAPEKAPSPIQVKCRAAKKTSALPL